MPPFTLWLEWEEVGGPPDHPALRPQQNFGNVAVTLADGRRYALNVWTFDYLPLARLPQDHEPPRDAKPAAYVIPPDLFVESLTRATMEAVVAEMLKEGELLDKWLSRPDI
jgi:hypothetical protein